MLWKTFDMPENGGQTGGYSGDYADHMGLAFRDGTRWVFPVGDGASRAQQAALIEAEMRLLHPLGRVAMTDEVAAAVAYLLSPDASFISGATLPVDGGRTVLARDPEAI